MNSGSSNMSREAANEEPALRQHMASSYQQPITEQETAQRKEGREGGREGEREGIMQTGRSR